MGVSVLILETVCRGPRRSPSNPVRAGARVELPAHWIPSRGTFHCANRCDHTVEESTENQWTDKSAQQLRQLHPGSIKWQERRRCRDCQYGCDTRSCKPPSKGRTMVPQRPTTDKPENKDEQYTKRSIAGQRRGRRGFSFHWSSMEHNAKNGPFTHPTRLHDKYLILNNSVAAKHMVAELSI